MKKDKKKKTESSKARLHFSRMRAVEEPTFYDAQTDMRQLIPAFAKVAITSLEEQYKDEDLRADLRYLHSCLCIFQLRVIEDPTPVDEQIAEFLAALFRCQPSTLQLWMSAMVTAQFSIYGLFCRRDAKADKETLRGMLEYSRLALYKRVLSDSTYKKMQEELRVAGVVTPQQAETRTTGFAVCHETKEVLKNIQAIAHMFISCSGDKSWNELAKACDEAFQGQVTDDTKTNIALALAYPVYEVNSLTVEVPANEATRKTK